MAGKQSELFDIINKNFFGLLSGQNKEVNFLLLAETDRAFGSSLTMLSRKKLIDVLAEFIRVYHIERVAEMGEKPDEQVLDNPRAKASAYVADLENRGWLERESDINFNPIVGRSSAFLAIFSALTALLRDEDNPNEYAGSLLQLYRNTTSFDYDNATASLQLIESDSKELSRTLLSINSRIKRFVGKAMGDSSLTEKEILRTLAVDYQRLNAFVAFHNLLTKNNPKKYARRIIEAMEDMRSVENKNRIIDDYVATKALPDEPYSRHEAEVYIDSVIEMVIDQMENIDASVSTIASRNRTYVTSSSDRLRFRLHSERDIKGDIQTILHAFILKGPGEDFDYGASFQLHKFNQLDHRSPYTARSLARIAPKQLPFTPTIRSQEAIEKAAALLNGNDAYAPAAVFSYLDKHIGKRSQMKASELNISSIDELIFAMLIPSYCGSADSHYQISAPLYEKFHCLGYAIEDYLIIRKKEKAL